MPFAVTPSTCPNDEGLRLIVLTTPMVISSVVCLILFLFYMSYYLFTQRYSSRIQTQNQDIEQGLSSQQQQQQRVIINSTEYKVKEDPRASKFKKVSWTAFKRDIINNKSHQNDDAVNKTSTCVICLEEFRDGDECKVRSKCNHIFHQTCIDDWLDDHSTCPLCRGRVRRIAWPSVTTADDWSPD